MKTLLINAHPDFANTAHYSHELQESFLDLFQQQFPKDALTILNLYAQPIPIIAEGQLQSIWAKQANNLPMTAGETELAQQSNALLEQFKAHHRIVIVSPLHNFNITSGLKNYLDNILIARQTFKYISTPDARGKVSVGLMQDDYRALLLFASGSIYTDHNIYETLDFAPQYLKSMFQEIMGFDHFGIVRAQGTAQLTPEQIHAHLDGQMQTAFNQLYATKSTH